MWVRLPPFQPERGETADAPDETSSLRELAHAALIWNLSGIHLAFIWHPCRASRQQLRTNSDCQSDWFLGQFSRKGDSVRLKLVRGMVSMLSRTASLDASVAGLYVSSALGAPSAEKRTNVAGSTPVISTFGGCHSVGRVILSLLELARPALFVFLVFPPMIPASLSCPFD